MTAVAYIRRSASGEAQASEQLQRETVAQLASERDDTISHVFRDWGRSGGSETRPQYLAMLAQAEAGDVDVIYAYDQDLLARSNFLFASLLRLADVKGFSIITSAGDLTDEDRRDFAEMRGVMDGGELRKITKRNRAVKKLKQQRGDDPGTVAFGYRKVKAKGGELNRKGEPVKAGANIDVKVDPAAIERVLGAYREAGTFLGAAKALTEAGEPIPFAGRKRVDGEPYGDGRFGAAIWRATTVRRIVLREAPELAPEVKGMSRKHRPHLFSKLLRCYCGQTLTPGGRPKSPGYWCTRGQRDPQHGRPWSIAESRLLPWIAEEAARLVDHDTYYREGDMYDDDEQRRGLAAMREAIGEDAYALAIANMDAKQAEHGEREQIALDVPRAIDFERWDTEDINRALRALWHHVELGADLLPVRAEWRVPEWRG